MAINVKQIKLNKEQLLSFLPIIVSALAIIFIVFVLILPQINRLSLFSKEIVNKKQTLDLAGKGSLNFQEAKNEIAGLEKKIEELEKKLPSQIETTLLIDTLKDITEVSKLKFSSIEPLPARNFELKGQEEFYVELPINVRLNCSYVDLIKFIQKIENSTRLMKISELTVSGNTQNIWEHSVELVISSFAKGKK